MKAFQALVLGGLACGIYAAAFAGPSHSTDKQELTPCLLGTQHCGEAIKTPPKACLVDSKHCQVDGLRLTKV